MSPTTIQDVLRRKTMKFLLAQAGTIGMTLVYLMLGLIVAGSYYVAHRVILETQQFEQGKTLSPLDVS
jgi:hypothetical protein